MLPVRTVLHPTDFSERSDHAFRLACALARDCGARLFVLHVLRSPLVLYGGGAPPPGAGQAEEEWNKLRQLQPRATGVQVVPCLAEGDPAEAILRAARETRCDLILMGTHGRTGLGRLLMGSVAEQVVRKAPCAVLMVKAPLPAPPQPLAGSGAAKSVVVPGGDRETGHAPAREERR
jgi:nucleotide-binding universal stress UspA family protein